MKSKDKAYAGYDSSGTGHDDSKNSAPSTSFRRTRNATERRMTRGKYSKNKRQKVDEDDIEGSDIDIPNQYSGVFESFKSFIDELIHGDVPPELQTSKSTKQTGRKNKGSSRASNKDSDPNQVYANENQSKFLHDTDSQRASNYGQVGRNGNSQVNSQTNQGVDMTNSQSQNDYHNNAQQNNKELLMQLLQSQLTSMRGQPNNQASKFPTGKELFITFRRYGRR